MWSVGRQSIEKWWTAACQQCGNLPSLTVQPIAFMMWMLMASPDAWIFGVSSLWIAGGLNTPHCLYMMCCAHYYFRSIFVNWLQVFPSIHPFGHPSTHPSVHPVIYIAAIIWCLKHLSKLAICPISLTCPLKLWSSFQWFFWNAHLRLNYERLPETHYV